MLDQSIIKRHVVHACVAEVTSFRSLFPTDINCLSRYRRFTLIVETSSSPVMMTVHLDLSNRIAREEEEKDFSHQ